MNFNYVYIIRLSLAFLAGLLIGVEREREDKPAGLRTCIILCFTMCLAMILNLELFESFGKVLDLARLPAYAIAGMGFLGAGVIKAGKKSEGVTTASTLLSLVIIGLLCGVGLYMLAGISTLVIFFVLMSKRFEIKFLKKDK